MALLLLPVLLCWAKQAWATVLDLQLGAGAAAGYTDNALGTPSGAAGSGSDAILLGRAEAGLALLGRYSEHRFLYTFTASGYLRQSGGSSLSNSLGWEGAFDPTSALRLTASVAATQSRLSVLDVTSVSGAGSGGAGATGPRPASALQYVSADARQGASLEVGPYWRVLQSLDALGFWPLQETAERPSSLAGALALGLERSFLRDGVSLNGRGLVMLSHEVRRGGELVTAQRFSDAAEADLGWRHSWSPVWTSYLAAGGLILQNPAGSRTHFEPAGRGEVAARSDTNELLLRVERAPVPNVFVGNLFVSTRALVSAAKSFGSVRRLEVRGVGSYDRSSLLDNNGTDTGGATVWQLRAILGYGLPGPLIWTLEYAFTDQRGIAASTPEAVATVPFASFHRNLIMLGVEYRYSSLRPATGAAPPRIRDAGDPAEDPRR